MSAPAEDKSLPHTSTVNNDATTKLRPLEYKRAAIRRAIEELMKEKTRVKEVHDSARDAVNEARKAQSEASKARVRAQIALDNAREAESKACRDQTRARKAQKEVLSSWKESRELKNALREEMKKLDEGIKQQKQQQQQQQQQEEEEARRREWEEAMEKYKIACMLANEDSDSDHSEMWHSDDHDHDDDDADHGLGPMDIPPEILVQMLSGKYYRRIGVLGAQPADCEVDSNDSERFIEG